MNFIRKSLQGMALVMATSLPAAAQDATSFVVGYAPGGGNDLAARIVAEALTKSGKGTFIVENKPGAGGRLAADALSKAKPDGKQFLATGNSVVSMAAAIYPSLPYDPLNDLIPVAMIAEFPQIVMIVAKDHPAQSFAEFVAWSQANPEKSNYAAVAPAYTLPTEQLKLDSGLIAEAVSFKSSSEALVGVLNGEISFLLGDHNNTLPTVEGGQTRALLVTGPARLTKLPEVPSAAELGYPAADISLWTGIFAPKGTAPEITEKLAADISEVLGQEETRAKFEAMGVAPGLLVTGEFAAQIAKEAADFAATVKAAGLKFE